MERSKPIHALLYCRWPKRLSDRDASVLSLLGELGLDGLLPLLQLALGLEAHDAATPLPLEALVELSVEVRLEGGELALVLLVDVGEADHGGVLLVHEGAEASLKTVCQSNHSTKQTEGCRGGVKVSALWYLIGWRDIGSQKLHSFCTSTLSSYSGACTTTSSNCTFVLCRVGFFRPQNDKITKKKRTGKGAAV